jgi:3-deoxy-D-manno-octulosonic-acid transferase
MLRLLYNLLWHLALPLLPLRLWWRGLKEPLYRCDWRQRFGLSYPPRRDERPLVWVHAVSLGETRAAQPLVAALRARYPGHALLLTHMTATGRAAAAELYGAFAELAYLPYDFPWAMKRFLRHYRPALGLVMETEVWPNLLAQARAEGAPVFLVNARLSEASSKSYMRLRGFFGESFSAFAAIGAQTEADAARLRALGGNASVTGNLKFDVASTPRPLVDFRPWFAGARLFLAASTREGEETLLLDALAREALPPDVRVFIVPRHPQRFDEVAALLKRRGIEFGRRSEGPAAAQRAYVLGDSVGEMSAYYAAADMAYIGGTLLPFGGQNLIEACAEGTPVLLGPSTFNFAEAAQLAIAAGAAVQVNDAAEVIRQARLLFADRVRHEAMRRSALDFSVAHRGSTQRVMALVEPLMARG